MRSFLGPLVLEAYVDPVSQHAELGLAARQAVAPARMGGQRDEVEVAGAEGAHVGRPPEGLPGEILRALFGARRIDLGRQAVEGDGAAIEQEADALTVAAGIGHPVGIDQVPARPEDLADPAVVLEVVAQLDQADQVELAQDLGDIVDRGLGPALLAKLADVPDRDIDRFIELGRRDLRRRDALPERQQAGRDVRRDVAMVHMIPASISCPDGRESRPPATLSVSAYPADKNPCRCRPVRCKLP